jgi:repressor LexA
MDRTSKKDLQGYAFLRNSVLHSGVIPSLREIGRAIGYGSPRSVQLMLHRLQKKGLISYQDGIIKLSPAAHRDFTERTVAVPLIGSVACGSPSLAEQQPEALIEISTRIVRPHHSYFLLRAAGTSMNKSGINEGDLVLVRQQSTAHEGERVVALINDEATVKHFYREGKMVVLKPNSRDKQHKPIILSEEFLIQGVVVAVLPRHVY